MADKWPAQLVARLKKAYTSGEYSDLTITYGNYTHHVHKVIVCSGSGLFAGALRFTVGKEAEDNHINLPEDDPAAVKAVLDYLYTADYEPNLAVVACPAVDCHGEKSAGYTYRFPHTCVNICGETEWLVCPHHACASDTCGNDCQEFTCSVCVPDTHPESHSQDASQLLLHAKVYAIADKYVVDGLQELSREKFASACEKYWNNGQFVIAAEYMYTATPDRDTGIRQVVCDTIVEHLTLIDKENVEELLSEVPGLAKDVLKKMAKGICRRRPGANPQYVRAEVKVLDLCITHPLVTPLLIKNMI